MASASQRGLGLLPRELLRIECFRSRPHCLVFVHQRVGKWIDPRTRLLRPLFQRLEPDRGVRRLAQLGEPLLPGLALRLLGGGRRVGWRGVRGDGGRRWSSGASGLRRSAAGAGGPSGDVSVGTWRAARDAAPVGIATTALAEPLVGADSGASGGGLPQAESPANSRRPRHRARREHITRRRSRDGRMAADLSGDGVEMGSGLVLVWADSDRR